MTQNPGQPEHFLDYDKSLACVHCGLCLASCPTYLESGNENDSPRGRIYLMRAVQDGRLPLGDTAVRHVDLCLGCRACESACPSGVEYGALVEAARPFLEPFRPARARWARRALTTVLTVSALRRVAFAPVRLLSGRRWLAA